MIPAKSTGLIIGVAALLAVVIFALRVTAPPAASNSNALTKTYSNAAYGFTLKMPADFSAYPPDASTGRDATGAPTVQTIGLQNTRGAAVQIVVTSGIRPQSTNILTADDIAQFAPYLDLSQAEPIQIAPGVMGMTFIEAEHPAYGDATEEVWFAYRGNQYEVIADAKIGALLRSMLATWTFF
jgi:hypothetical protein